MNSVKCELKEIEVELYQRDKQEVQAIGNYPILHVFLC